MPIYEYRCTQCGHKLEALQKFSDAPLTTCPACAKETLAKQVSAAGFQLKGSGWYQTDFRGSGKPAEKTDAAKDGAKADGNGGGAKSDAATDSSSSKESSTTGATSGSGSDKATSTPSSSPPASPAAS